MKYTSDTQFKKFKRDVEAVCGFLEFLCTRLGIRLDFSDYVSGGLVLDDDGGFVDIVRAELDLHETEFDDLRQRLSDLELTMGKLTKRKLPDVVVNDTPDIPSEPGYVGVEKKRNGRFGRKKRNEKEEREEK